MDPVLQDSKNETPLAEQEPRHFNVVSRGKKRKLFEYLGNKEEIGAFNLAGRISHLKQINQGIRRTSMKTIPPQNLTNLTKDPYWHFIVRSSKQEWVRLATDSLSMVIFATYDNPNVAAATDTTATAEGKAARHALRAFKSKPDLFLDPTIQGTTFIKSVSVSVNNFPVATNENLNGHLGHYVRAAHIFSRQRYGQYPHLLTSDDIKENATALKAGSKPFDYLEYNATEGVRIPIFLDGIFPFDFKNKTLQSIQDWNSSQLYFPPDSIIDIKLYLNHSKMESLFHKGITMSVDSTNNYFKKGAAEDPGGKVEFTVQDVTLRYESTELTEFEYIRAMKQFSEGRHAIYQYDVVRIQQQSITAKQSYTENIFQINPDALLIYVLCLPDWAVIPLPSEKKPLSGLTRFPPNVTDISISFAGEENLITRNFKRFGVAGVHNEITQHIYYQHLRKLKIFPYDYENLFPRDATSYVQSFILDVSRYLSKKTELLKIDAQYNSSLSPDNYMYLVMSVHPTGCGDCSSPGQPYQWQWRFT